MFKWFAKKKKSECLEKRADIDDPPAGFDIMNMSTVSNVERIELPEGPVILIWPKNLHRHSLVRVYSWFCFLMNHQESVRHHLLNPDLMSPKTWTRYGAYSSQEESS